MNVPRKLNMALPQKFDQYSIYYLTNYQKLIE